MWDMNYPQIMYRLSPLFLKVGGHVPQLLWERRPWLPPIERLYKIRYAIVIDVYSCRTSVVNAL